MNEINIKNTSLKSLMDDIYQFIKLLEKEHQNLNNKNRKILSSYIDSFKSILDLKNPDYKSIESILKNSHIEKYVEDTSVYFLDQETGIKASELFLIIGTKILDNV